MAKTKGPLDVCSFGPIQTLYEKAKVAADGGDLIGLIKAVKAIETAALASVKLEHVREFAREIYVTSECDIDIDDANLTHHNGEPTGDGGGYWVGAWLWVRDEDLEDE